MENNDLHNPNIKKEEITQPNASENMYSYRDNNNNNNKNNNNNNNNNNIDNVQEAGAIRRSIGEGNPNINYPQNNIGTGYDQNYMNNDNIRIKNSQEKNSDSNEKSSYWVTYFFLGCIEVLIIILLAVYFEKKISYDCDDNNDQNCNYGLLRDMNIMVFIGFGMLHSILRRNSWISISINMLILSFSIQFSLLFNYIWKLAFKEDKDYEEIFDFNYLMKAIFISSSTLVTLGSVLGKLSIIQYIIMAIFETILSSLNYQLCELKLKAIDYGGSLYIHSFGAIFALSITAVLFCSSKIKLSFQNYDYLNKSNYFSNLTSFLGIIILFCYFPSFNSALAKEGYRDEGRINTYLSLFGSVMGSFITSGFYNKGRFIFEEIFLGSISGAIIISGCCTVCLEEHWASILIGTLGSFIIVTYLSKIKPFFVKWGLQDTCNIIILHGISGLLGSFITPMFISNLDEKDLDDMKEEDTTSVSSKEEGIEPGGRAGIQIGAIFITIGISFIGGIATGYLMKISKCGKINQYFTDAEFFIEEENNIFEYIEPNTVFNVDINNPSLFKMDYPVYNNQKVKSEDMRGSQPSY